jgi:hypothetical protein
MTPVRHALGALLLEQGRVAEAAHTYREDLAPGRHPGNVWALHGLASCLEILAAAGTEAEEACTTERESVVAQLQAAQADADVEIKASCACARLAWDAAAL